ncbi:MULTISPECIES: class I SAM-dependent methyltransferase [Sulfitobacter]|uniref:Class I SAM-dependent methyltransferase n=1 Tax=Sulfitobacter profundi TaxID=2679961 RepID=A0ABW1Z5B0_9RHOB|nr:class I SAM-dependent methyltransferase [Sulfitobacter indolifex]
MKANPDIDTLLAKDWGDLNKLERQTLTDHFSHHAHEKEFNWDWSSINYNRIALINYITARIPNCAYLEIGCDLNQLFDSIPLADKTGVDPARGGTHRQTSDEFFASNTKKFDVIWIDGLHEYTQVHRDIVHSIAALKPGGFIALHDMLPTSWLFEHMPRISGRWNGDVWKVAPELMVTEGIDFKIVQIDHGCGILQVTESAAVLVDLSDMVGRESFAYYSERVQRFPLITWAQAIAWIDDALERSL